MKRSVLATLFFLPGAAQAHLVSTGIGPFYDGLVHLFVSLQDLLFCLGIGLLAGLSRKDVARTIMLFAAVAWIAGATVGLQEGNIVSWNLAAPVLLLLVGVLVALDARLPPVVTIAFATLTGAVHGFINGTALTPLGFAGVLGTYSAFLVMMLLIAAAVVGLRALWTRTAVRVAGSWIGAAGLLLLGWTIRPMFG